MIKNICRVTEEVVNVVCVVSRLPLSLASLSAVLPYMLFVLDPVAIIAKYMTPSKICGSGSRFGYCCSTPTCTTSSVLSLRSSLVH